MFKANYRSAPVEIEATRIYKKTDHQLLEPLPKKSPFSWTQRRKILGLVYQVSPDGTKTTTAIPVERGDWICCGKKTGMIQVYKHEEFKKLFTPIEG